MILDSLQRADRYRDIHPAFARAFAYLRSTDLAARDAGRYEVDADRSYISIDHIDGRGPDAARLEHHRAYIDIQVTIEGDERIGWSPLEACRTPDGPFDESKDIGFFGDRPQSWIDLRPGLFVIFFPTDAHAPLGATGPVRKAIVKIRV